ncbi:hypothetical protein A3H26_02105 [candidate division WWE3 bacterium RIFCSPLOWO2_12_FULL_36_10]|uniref:DUF4012 domain-containing protein n=1 Tax=candidate division WWE3 bacterium RIFCSPLOWO2_12_FULL_36_10 TaxID=1802630 RepID=A0A1F4VJ02_UNCKA|nr:MAG: hypothetical protein A3H26_02105 [candidate division WWE3 bacterium RIFCSPLOWO2_12_FULL_36_10]
MKVKFLKKKKYVWTFLSVFFILFVFLYYFLISPLLGLYSDLKQLKSRVRPIKSTITGSVSGMQITSDMEFLPFELDYLKDYLTSVDKKATRLQIFSRLPIIGGYFKDLKTVTSLSLDVADTSTNFFSSMQNVLSKVNLKNVGFYNSSIGDNPGTGISELANFLTTELPKYKERVWVMNKKLQEIDSERYPYEFKGYEIRNNIVDAQKAMSFVVMSFDDIVKSIGVLPDLMGEKGSRTFLVILQNENKLRPSGGILSAYAVFNINRGAVNLVKSGDVYNLDPTQTVYNEPPEFLSKYAVSDNFYLKDAGYSANFPTSSGSIYTLWKENSKNIPIDGLIVIDSHFIKTLLNVSGKVKVPDFGEVGSENVQQYLNNFFAVTGSEELVDKTQKDRVSVLLLEIMKKILVSGSEKKFQLLQFIMKEIDGGHLLFNSIDPGIQSIAKKYKLTGDIEDFDGDFLYISSANISDANVNSDLVMSVTKRSTIESKDITTELNLQFSNVSKTNFDVFRNYIKVYLPENVEILETSDNFIDHTIGKEYNKSYVDGLVNVNPGSITDIKIKYNVPLSNFDAGKYRLLIQKQPGAVSQKYSLSLGAYEKDVDLDTNKIVEFDL